MTQTKDANVLLEIITITGAVPQDLDEAIKQLKAVKALGWMGYLYGRSISYSFGEDVKFLEWRNEHKQKLDGLTLYAEKKSFLCEDDYYSSLVDYGTNRIAEDWILYALLYPQIEEGCELAVKWLPKEAFDDNTIFYMQIGCKLDVSWGKVPCWDEEMTCAEEY